MRRSPIRPRARARRSALRVVGGRVETAVYTLRHPRSGRTVTLVGTMHIGDAAYFEVLSTTLAALAAGGAEVHVEGIAHRGDDRLTRWERARLTEARRWKDPETSGAGAAALQLESQSGLRLPEGARNIDLSHAELLRRVGWATYRRLIGPGPTGASPPVPGPWVRAAIRFQLRHFRGIEAVRALAPHRRRIDRVVIDERNAVACAGAVEALGRGDVVLVWGAAHLPGLARLLEQRGYRGQGECWVTACTV